jgi:hypothetical protein
MKTIRTFALVLGLASGLAPAAAAQSGGAANGTQPLMLDLSKFQREKFVTEGKTNE